MPKFLFVFHGGKKPDSQEEGEKVMAAWMKWLNDLGPKVVDPGEPVGKSTTIFPNDVVEEGAPDPASGYSIIEAADKAEAVEHARNCPHLTVGGHVEVAEIIPIEM